MTTAKTVVQLVLDDNHKPVAMMPYDGKATLFMVGEASADEIALLIKEACDSPPPVLITRESNDDDHGNAGT